MKKFMAIFLISTIFLSQGTLCFSQEVDFAEKVNSMDNVIVDTSYTENSSSVSGTEENVISKDLEACINKAKSIFHIPSEFDEFEFNSYKYNNKLVYELYWNISNKSVETSKNGYGNSGSISVGIDSDGNIYNYYKTYNEYSEQDIVKYTNDDCKKTAIAFFNNVLPEYVSQYEVYDSKHLSSKYTSQYQYYFTRKLNNIPVTFNTVSIQVSPKTNEVVSYNIQNPQMLSKQLPDISSVISKDDALEKFHDEVFDDVRYKSYSKEKSDKDAKKSLFLGYSISEIYNKVVNANTGEIVDRESLSLYSGGGYGTGEYERDASAKNTLDMKIEKQLTEAEIKEIEQTNKIISESECLKIINERIPLKEKIEISADDTIFLNKISNSSNKEVSYYIYNINLKSASITINAVTGEIEDFYIYNFKDVYADEDDKSVSEEEMEKNKNTLLSFLEKNSPDKLSKIKIADKNNESYFILFERIYDGIKYPENFVSAHFDKDGTMVGYNSDWDYDITFPKQNGLISKKEAFSILNDNFKFGLAYVYDEKYDNIFPAFTYIDTYQEDYFNESYLINAENKKIVNYNNIDIEEINSEKHKGYADIDSIDCKEIVQKLYDSGYYINDTDFSPEKEITINEFYNFYSKNNKNEKEKAEFLKNIGLPAGIKNDDARLDMSITKLQAAKFASRLFAKEPILQSSEIFKFNSENENIEDENISYIAVSVAAGIIQLEDDGTFSPDKPLTREEAAVIIYNIFK